MFIYNDDKSSTYRLLSNVLLDAICVCVCVHRECQGAAHEPCDCQTWKMWLQKVSEMRPEECEQTFFMNAHTLAHTRSHHTIIA